MADDDEWTRDAETDAVGMMREFSKSAQERVEALLRRAAEMREAVRQRGDIMWLQNDCIYNAFVRPQLPGEVIREIEGRLE